ncbi:MAG TPA: peptidoglycan-binding protein [Synechococcales cyanobacterium M55_K2018_004]|nr:peptidoglycan-binding protein [Synechococcales cyanobacterium M55_K2018_004]
MADYADRYLTLLQRPGHFLLLAAGLAMITSLLPAIPTAASRPPMVTASSNNRALSTPLQLSQAPAVLRLEDSGDAVTALQTRLTELGFYNGPISGVFGPQTEAAVIRFQAANGLVADGMVGPATRAALERSSRPSAATGSTPASDGLLRQGDSGELVTALQQRLRTLGYYNGGIDGIFGPQTEAAVIAFQRSQGINADGIVGRSTAAALLNPSPATATNPTPNPQPTPPATPTPPNSGSGVLPPPQVFPAPVFPTPDSPSESVAVNPDRSNPAADTEGKFSVLELQWMLRQRGFYRGPIDGVLGSETRRAISDAQRSYGLSERDLSR